MAVLDFFGLFCEILLLTAPFFSPIHAHNTFWLCVFYISSRFMFTMSSSLMFACMSIERVSAVYFPFKYKQSVSVRLMAVVGLCCFLTGLAGGCAANMKYTNEGGKCFVAKENVSIAIKYYVRGQSFHLAVVPSILTAVLNALVIFKMGQRKCGLVAIRSVKIFFTF